MVIIPQVFGRAPRRLRSDHPLLRHAAHLVVMGGSLTDLASGRVLTQSFNSISPGRHGMEARGNSATRFATQRTYGASTYPLWVAGGGYFLSSSSNWGMVALGAAQTAGGGSDNLFGIRLASSTTVEGRVRNGLGSLSTLTSAAITGVNTGASIFGALVSYSQTDHRLFVNGLEPVLDVTDVGTLAGRQEWFAAGAGSVSGGSSPVVVGGLNGGLFYTLAGYTPIPEIYLRWLSQGPDFFASIFDPRRTWILLPPAGAGAELAGVAIGQAAAQATLTTAIRLEGAALANVLALGALTAQIRLEGAALANVLATGNLTAGSGLEGAAVGQAAAQGALTTSIRLAGATAAQAAALAALTSGIQLSGQALAQAAAQGNLTAVIQLTGAAIAQAQASGSLTALIQLQGAAINQAVASGTLAALAVLMIDKRYFVGGGARDFRVLH